MRSIRTLVRFFVYTETNPLPRSREAPRAADAERKGVPNMMKRGMALFLCLLLLLPFGWQVAAEETVRITKAEQNGERWLVEWDAEDAVLTEMSIGELILGSDKIDTEGTRAEVDISGAPYGRHDVTYRFSVKDGEPQEVTQPGGFVHTGKAKTRLELELRSGENTLKAVLTDAQGNPVEGAELWLSVGSTKRYLSRKTDADGAAEFRSLPQLKEGMSVQVDFDGLKTADGVEYTATSADKTVTFQTTTSSQNASGTTTSNGDTTTTSSTETTGTTGTTQPLPTLPSADGQITTGTQGTTYGTVHGEITTSAADDRVWMNVLSDVNLLKAFGGGINTFNGKARISVSAADYARLTATYGGTVVGAFYTSPLSLTAEQIETARQASADFASLKNAPAHAITFQLSLQAVSADGLDLRIDDTSTLENMMYTVELPIPTALQGCTVFGVAMTGDGVVATPTKVTAKGGVVTFTVPVLGHFSLIGFEGETDSSGDSQQSSLLLVLFIVLLVVGILLLVGMGVLIYLFFIRKKQPAEGSGEEKVALSGAGETRTAEPHPERYSGDAPSAQAPANRRIVGPESTTEDIFSHSPHQEDR